MSAPDLQSNAVDVDPVEAPLYTAWEVARYLRAPVWAVHGLWSRQPPPDPWWCLEWYFKRHGPFALWGESPESQDRPERLSFRQFADLYVRCLAARSLLELTTCGDPDPGKTRGVQKAAWGIVTAHGLQPVLFGDALPDSVVVELAESWGGALGEEGQHLLHERLRLGLDRVARDEGGGPSRLYPLSRWPPEGCPRRIVMDPRIRFGRPTLAGRGIPTDILFERHQAGDSILALSDDYGVTAEEVEEAIRFEGSPNGPVFSS